MGLFSKKIDLKKPGAFSYKDALLISYAINEEMIETAINTISHGNLPANSLTFHLNEALIRVAKNSFKEDTAFIESFLSEILTPGELEKAKKDANLELKHGKTLEEIEEIVAVILGKASRLEPITNSVNYVQSYWFVVSMDDEYNSTNVAFQKKYCEVVLELMLASRSNYAADIDWMRVVKFTLELALVFSMLSLPTEK